MENKSINLHDLSVEHLQQINIILNKILEVRQELEANKELSNEFYEKQLDEIFRIIFEAEKTAKKCSTCGEILSSFEWQVCGPCRMKSSRFKEEIGE